MIIYISLSRKQGMTLIKAWKMQKHSALINIEQNTFDSYHATLSTLDFLNRFPLLTSNLYILKERINLTRQQQLYTKNSIGLQQLDPGS